MGTYNVFKCVNCGEEFGLMLGVGMQYPLRYQEVLTDIKNGKYGKEWKKLIEENENLVFDAYVYLYYCPNCGTWDSAYGLDLYYPKDIDKVNEEIETEFKKRVNELAGRSRIQYRKYSQDEELKTHEKNWHAAIGIAEGEYELLAEYPYVCKKCGKQMKRVKEDVVSKEIVSVLRCPNCNCNLEGYITGQWD